MCKGVKRFAVDCMWHARPFAHILERGVWVFSRRVSNAALANELENWKNIRDGGQGRKTNPKSLGATFSLCCRAGIDAALVKAQMFFFLLFLSQVHPPSRIKLNKEFKH